MRVRCSVCSLTAPRIPLANISTRGQVLAVFQPGAYTAIVSGKDGGTGVGLVGVFAVP